MTYYVRYVAPSAEMLDAALQPVGYEYVLYSWIVRDATEHFRIVAYHYPNEFSPVFDDSDKKRVFDAVANYRGEWRNE